MSLLEEEEEEDEEEEEEQTGVVRLSWIFLTGSPRQRRRGAQEERSIQRQRLRIFSRSREVYCQTRRRFILGGILNSKNWFGISY